MLNRTLEDASNTSACKKSSPAATSSDASKMKRTKSTKLHSRDDDGDDGNGDEENDGEEKQEKEAGNVEGKKRQKKEEVKEKKKEEIVRRIKLDESDPEFIRVKDEFFSSFQVEEEYSTSNVKVTSIEHLVNTTLEARFEAAMKDAAARGTKHTKQLVCYHGTPARNIESICREGLRLDLIGKTNDNEGYYGKGCYSAPSASYAIPYCRVGSGGAYQYFVSTSSLELNIECQSNKKAHYSELVTIHIPHHAAMRS